MGFKLFKILFYIERLLYVLEFFVCGVGMIRFGRVVLVGRFCYFSGRGLYLLFL